MGSFGVEDTLWVACQEFPTTSDPLGNSQSSRGQALHGWSGGWPEICRWTTRFQEEHKERVTWGELQEGDLFWVWIPCKQLKKQCKAMYCGQASINLRTKPVISRDRIRRVYHKKSKHGHQTSYHTRWRSPISKLYRHAYKMVVLSLVAGAKSTRGTAWFMKKCSWDKLAREWGKHARGRERNQARLLHWWNATRSSHFDPTGDPRTSGCMLGLVPTKSKEAGLSHTLAGKWIPRHLSPPAAQGSLLNKVLSSSPHKWSFQSLGDGSSEAA